MNASASAASALRCFHCGAPIAGAVCYRARIADEEQPMCCPGCQAVAETIAASGLDNYYRFRTGAAQTAQPAVPFELYDRADVQADWLQVSADGATTGEWLIAGMRCTACVWLLEQQLRRLPGVVAADVDLSEQRAHIVWRSPLQPAAIATAIAAVGYQPQPYSLDAAERLRRHEERQALRRVGVAGFGMMQVGMCALSLYAGAIYGIEPVYANLLRWASLALSVPVVIYSGWPFFAGAWRGLRARRPGMDVPVALAIAFAFAASTWTTLRGIGDVYFDSVTMFIFLLLGGRYLEMRARHYAGRLGTDVLSLLPRAALRIESDGQLRTVPATALRVGDIALVGDGQTVPADGELLDEHARINEATLTGEFLPVTKRSGQPVAAGTVNGVQPIRIRVTGVGRDLRLAAIHSLGQRALQQKPQQMQLADRLAASFVWVVLAAALATGALWWWLEPARAFGIVLSVLAVSCPCALGLATPATITSATQMLRRRGLLVTRVDVWEKLPRLTDVVFDKTGTLTIGAMRVQEIRPLNGRSAEICLDIAAALEAGSTHPIAQAFAERAAVAAENRTFTPANGVEGTIAGRRYRLGQPRFASAPTGLVLAAPATEGRWILLADSREPLCWFQLGDQLRDDAASTVAALQRRGLRLHELSGDSVEAVAAVAAQLRIPHNQGGASPEQKLRYIADLQRQGRHVLVIGDGINDVPVLAAADVSVAMTNASDLAKSNADCILLAPRLDHLPRLLDTALLTRRIIRQNLAWTLAYNALAIPMAMAGLVPPWLAAIGMSASSLLVIGNALRLPLAAREP